jgi:hypothetical protein
MRFSEYLASLRNADKRQSTHGASIPVLDDARGLAVLVVLAFHPGAFGMSGLMIEAREAFFLQRVRHFSYKNDALFDWQTERALRPAELVTVSNGLFRLERVFSLGGPASLLIFNSLIFRLPLTLKKWLVKPLFGTERAWNLLAKPWLFRAFGAVWRREGSRAPFSEHD